MTPQLNILKIAFFSFILLCVNVQASASAGSTRESTPEQDFKQVDSHEDLKAFAGSVVAYKTNSRYLGSEKGYPIASDASVKYGYVSPASERWQDVELGTEEGYRMTRLLRPNDFPRNCALVDSEIKRGAFLLRSIITKEESEKIKEALSTDKAKFEYVFNKEKAFAMLSGQ